MISKIKEIYQYRELLSVFTKKELKVKYKNSALGFLWSFINPLVLAGVYTFIFGYIFRDESIKNYPIFLIIGLLPWNFFAISISMCSGSIMGNANLVKKVSFPKEIIPLSIIFANLINFLLEIMVLFALLIVFQFNFAPYIPIFVITLLLQVIATIGFGLIFASLTVYFRDIEQLIQIILLVWFFATPIVYDMSKITNLEQFGPMIATFLKIANPLTATLLLYKQSLYYLNWPSINLMIYAISGPLIIFYIGYFIFDRLSPNFAKEV